MKKSVRKILSIVLILILVCTLATAVFAASNRFPLDINYDDLYEIEGLAELTQRGVSGYLAVIGPEPSTECYVNIRYKYYINNGGDLLLRPQNSYTVLSGTEYNLSYVSVSRTHSESNFYSTSYGYAKFEASIPHPLGVQRFNTDEQLIEYFVP